MNINLGCLPLRKDTVGSPIPLRPVLGPWQRRVLGMGQRRRWMDSVRDPNLNPPGAQLPGPPGNGGLEPSRLQLHCRPHLLGPGEQTDELQAAGPATVQHALPAGLPGAPGHPLGPRLLLPAVFEPLQHGTHSQPLAALLFVGQPEPAQPPGTGKGHRRSSCFRLLALPSEAPVGGGDVLGEPLASPALWQPTVCATVDQLGKCQWPEVSICVCVLIRWRSCLHIGKLEGR